MSQREQGHKGTPQWTQTAPRRDDLKERFRRAIEPRHLAPGVMIGVLDAPVMVLAADPVHDLERRVVNGQGPGKDRERNADQGLRPRSRAGVGVEWQEEERSGVASIVQIPADRMSTALGRAHQSTRLQSGLADTDGELRGRKGAGVERKLALDGDVACGFSVKRNRPQLSLRLFGMM